MSTLSQFAGGGVKSVQAGSFSSASLLTGAGSEKYINVTIAAVDPAKCLVIINGGAGSTADIAWEMRYAVLGALTSSTNLKIRSDYRPSVMVGQWQVIEFA